MHDFIMSTLGVVFLEYTVSIICEEIMEEVIEVVL